MQGRALPYAHLMDEIRKKELGPFSHFLDGIWRNFSFAAAGALGIAGLWALVQGEFAVYMLPVSVLATQLASGVHGLRDWRRVLRQKRIYDSPRCQDYLRSVEERAHGVVASQRGTVWIVMDPESVDNVSQIRVMSDREYQQFRAQGIAAGRSLDEVRIKQTSLGLTQVREGREHAPRDVDLATGRFTLGVGSGRIERWTKEAEDYARGTQRRGTGAPLAEASKAAGTSSLSA